MLITLMALALGMTGTTVVPEPTPIGTSDGSGGVSYYPYEDIDEKDKEERKKRLKKALIEDEELIILLSSWVINEN